MANRSGFRRRSSRGAIKTGRYLWEPFSSVATETIGQGNSKIADLSFTIDEDVRGQAKFVRCVGSVAFRMEQVSSDVSMATMIYVQRKEAFNAGVAPEWGLDRWNYVWTNITHLRIGSLLGGQNLWERIPIDTKVSRKMGQDSVGVLKLENTSFAAVTIEAVIDVRTLFWIP